MLLCYVIDSGLSTSLLLLATLIIMFYIYITCLYTLTTKSTVAETGDKSTTKSMSPIRSTLLPVYGAKVDRVEFNFLASVYRRSLESRGNYSDL